MKSLPLLNHVHVAVSQYDACEAGLVIGIILVNRDIECMFDNYEVLVELLVELLVEVLVEALVDG